MMAPICVFITYCMRHTVPLFSNGTACEPMYEFAYVPGVALLGCCNTINPAFCKAELGWR